MVVLGQETMSFKKQCDINNNLGCNGTSTTSEPKGHPYATDDIGELSASVYLLHLTFSSEA